jgi:hypothetical protein
MTQVLVRVDSPSWLPAGSQAEVVLAVGEEPPTPVGLVRLLLQRSSTVFCTARSGTRLLDLPTADVLCRDDGRSAVAGLAAAVFGRPTPVSLIGYFRNVVPSSSIDYPWPVPDAYFCVWTAAGDPVIDGEWLSTDDPSSPLPNRHWWPLAQATRGLS